MLVLIVSHIFQSLDNSCIMSRTPKLDNVVDNSTYVVETKCCFDLGIHAVEVSASFSIRYQNTDEKSLG